MHEEKITLIFPDSSRAAAQLQLTQEQIMLVTEDTTLTVPLETLASCRRDRKQDNACRISTKERMAYTLVFPTEKKLLRFMAMIDAQCEELTISTRRATKGLSKRAIALAVALCILIGAVGVGSYFLLDYLIPHYGANDVTVREVYALTSAKPGNLTMKHSVAVNADGETVLTNAVLQIAFWMDVYQFMNTYSSYLSSFGLSTSKPLSQQTAMTDRTWEQYFLEMSTVNFSNYYALYCEAQANSYQLPEDLQTKIDDVFEADGELASDAKQDGYDDVLTYLQEQFGDGVDQQAYQDYLRIYYTAMSYYDDVVYAEADAKVTDAEIEAEYEKNKSSTYSSYPQVYNVTIRHILIQPDGDKDTDTKTWSTTAWALAEDEINKIYEEWKENPTEDNFAELAKKYTDDSNGDEGGIYEDVTPNTMTTEFNDWIFDDARTDGETGIVKTSYGYHLIYFVEHTETRAWYNAAKSTLVSDLSNTTMSALTEKYPIRYDYSRVRIFDIIERNNNRPVDVVDK